MGLCLLITNVGLIARVHSILEMELAKQNALPAVAKANGYLKLNTVV